MAFLRSTALMVNLSGKKLSYLPKNEVFPDNVFHSLVAPNITIQTLTGKILNVLYVDHEPLVLHLTTLLSLETKKT